MNGLQLVEELKKKEKYKIYLEDGKIDWNKTIKLIHKACKNFHGEDNCRNCPTCANFEEKENIESICVPSDCKDISSEECWRCEYDHESNNIPYKYGRKIGEIKMPLNKEEILEKGKTKKGVVEEPEDWERQEYLKTHLPLPYGVPEENGAKSNNNGTHNFHRKHTKLSKVVDDFENRLKTTEKALNMILGSKPIEYWSDIAKKIRDIHIKEREIEVERKKLEVLKKKLYNN